MADIDGTKLDRILNGLASITSRLDSVEAKAKEKDDKASKSDTDVMGMLDAVMKKVDACMKRMDAMEETSGARKDTVINPSPEPVTTADSTAFIGAQIKAERVAQAFGDSAGAPRWMNGEALADYQRRLLTPYKRHSPAWRDVPAEALDAGVLDIAETQIYADAIAVASSPSSVGPGVLREVIETDRTGRRITKFVGDPEACWGRFKHAPLHVTGFDTPTKH